jgi:hypothetical protein
VKLSRFASILALTLLLAQAGLSLAGAGPEPAPAPLAKLAIPEAGAYTGAYLDFGTHEDGVTREKLEAFSRLVGKHQAIIAFSNYWGRGAFPSAQVKIIADYGAVPLIFWNPWKDQDDTRKSRFDLAAIEAGKWDTYIDAWARDARGWGKPLLVSWGLEMNGNWFPWSGVFHGAGKRIPGTSPPRYEGPETFKRVYRHVVDRVRAAGATNVSWVFQTNNTADPDKPWNRMAAYYPGSVYVDWLAMSAYGKQYAGEDWVPVKEAILDHYPELAAIDPTKPIILAEWGVAEFPKQGSKAAWLREALSAMAHKLPRLKGAVFWHERWQNGDSSYSNLYVDSSPKALAAYRDGVASPFWLSEPQSVLPDVKGSKEPK